MKTITVHNDKREKYYRIPSDATHYIFGSAYGVYYKIGLTWIHQGDNGAAEVAYDFDVDKYAKHYNLKIHKAHYLTRDNPINNIDYIKEAKDRINSAFGSLPVGKSFISNGFIKKGDLMKGSGWRIDGDGDVFSTSSLSVIVTNEMILKALEEFSPDFTKHKDCDIAVIRDIVEQYRNKIKQLQEGKK